MAEIRDIFNWFNEEKLLRRFQGLRATAEKISGDLQAQIIAEKLTVETLHEIQEEAISTRAALEALLDLARFHESKLAVVVAQEMEQVELMSGVRRKFTDYVDKTNDAAHLAGNATDALLSSPDAAAKMLAGFNPKVIKSAFDILADQEDWQTIGMVYDLAKDKLDGKG